MICLILAAGYATRLYPLTENFPKPLLKVGDKTILDWLIDDIESSGSVRKYIVISNHKFAPHFDKWAREKSERMGIHIDVVDDGTSTNDTRLGAVCDIQFAIDTLHLLDDEAAHDGFLVIAGDNVLDFSLAGFVDYSLKMKTSCIMRYYEADEKRLRKSGIAELAGGDALAGGAGRTAGGEAATAAGAAGIAADPDLVIGMEEKPANPRSHWCCPPFYYYTLDDAHLIKTGIEAGCGTDAPGSLAAWMITRRSVHAFEMPGRRYDIGNLESYEEVQKKYRGIGL